MDKALSKGEMENLISRALTQWEKEYLGRGSVLVKTDIVRNMIIVLLKGILTPAEQNLAKTQDGLLSIKKIRADLVESGTDQLKEIVEGIAQERISSFHTDISTRTGERIMVFMMEDNVEKKLQG
ncbi:DUF2294 domain-containing protein [Ammoniphilus sp. YIM 78166]|uniref:DUF2294 domain-containing protein n=1 Tax=Ammoniphilus sp. YIM 78166 TaxID=1644106 RepID=UPI0010704032|nr:DUF2294 domain-containing protein [Ammoniphilus sp. YIM 78166]